MTRVRLRFTKEGKVRFTSHRDVARILERMARRAGLPLSYSEGFSPRPKLHFGLALPTACASTGEYVDMDLEEPVDVESLPDLLTAHLPEGMEVVVACEVERGGPSLQEMVTSCEWSVLLNEVEVSEVEDVVNAALAEEHLEILRQRKGRTETEDIRGGIISVSVEILEPSGVSSGVFVLAELATQPRAVRPGDLIAALDPKWEPVCMRREHQWIDTGHERCEPLAVTGDPIPRASVRAS